MKLLTGLTVSRDGSLVDATDENLIHDAACAHALMLAMDRISSQVTFHTMTNRECVAQLLEAIRGTADEIMAGWGFDSGEVE